MNPALARRIQSIIPKLTSAKHKGDNGRIAVIGGSFEFTGAPYYSALSALKVGADMAHIFCAKSACQSIKSYSPEIIVHPVFTLSDEVDKKLEQAHLEQMWSQWLEKIETWQGAITSWVIGPGLGRDKHLEGFFPKMIKLFKKNSLLIFDADGLYYLAHHPQLFTTLKDHRVVLTPNHKELGLLQKTLEINLPPGFLTQNIHSESVVVHKGITFDYPFGVLVKGNNDLYFNSSESMAIMAQGGNKRCGGIGDILAGAIGACAGWDFHYGPVLAAWVVKRATRMAYQKQGRSLTAPSVLTYISQSFQEVQAQLDRISKAK